MTKLIIEPDSGIDPVLRAIALAARTIDVLIHVYGFNFTDTDYRSRSFGIVTDDEALVREALKLFEADATRQRYRTGHPELVVSPESSRPLLSDFIRGARRQLLIYDPRLGDESILQLLAQRALAGVDVRIIGKARSTGASILDVRKYPGRRLHVRAMVRDGERAFVGSQSLRAVAFDKRREIGVIVRDPGVIRGMQAVFERDWKATKR